MNYKRKKKKAVGKTIIVTIIVLVAIVIGAIVIANAMGFVMSGLLSFLGPSGASLNKVYSLTEKVCTQPDALLRSTIVVPKGHVIRVLPYDLETIGSYDECIGGTCMCIMKDQWDCDPQNPKDCEAPPNYDGPRYLQVPPSSRYRYCKPLAVPQNNPIYCCILGDCNFKNVADIFAIGTVKINNLMPYNELNFFENNVIWIAGANNGVGESAQFCSSLTSGDYTRATYSHEGTTVTCCYATTALTGKCQNIVDYGAGEIDMAIDGLPQGQYKVRIERLSSTQLGYTVINE